MTKFGARPVEELTPEEAAAELGAIRVQKALLAEEKAELLRELSQAIKHEQDAKRAVIHQAQELAGRGTSRGSESSGVTNILTDTVCTVCTDTVCAICTAFAAFVVFVALAAFVTFASEHVPMMSPFDHC